MDGDLVCNYKKCRKQIRSFAWVTSCSHVFCDEDGSREFNKSLTCPACDTTLSGKFDIIRSDVQPSEQWKSMVIAGQRPEVIMEICTRALSFWTYQILRRYHRNRPIPMLCCVLGASLLLIYMLTGKGHRRFDERELFQILDNHQLSNDVMPPIKTSIFKDVNKNKYLIYLCNEKQLCGSWEDRQAAIVSTFILAILTNRRFKVSMTSPCRLQMFLIPKEYNWLLETEELREKPFTVINAVRNSTILQTLQDKDFNTVYSHDVVFIQATTDFARAITENPFYKHKLPKWMLQVDEVVFKNTWEMLMTPSKYVHNRLNAMKSSLSKVEKMLCFYVQTASPTSFERRYQANIQLIKRVMDVITGKAANYMFIATDSSEFRKLARTEFKNNILDSGGAILDLDKDRDVADSCSAMENVILDQLILTQCSVLVISDSSFGKTTAVLRGIDEDLYNMDEWM